VREYGDEVRKCPEGWLSGRYVALLVGAARRWLRVVVGRILLVMRGVVLLLILVFGILIYRVLRCSLVFWVLILSSWMFAIVLRVLCCRFLVVHKTSISSSRRHPNQGIRFFG
jgi:hypothetical protein